MASETNGATIMIVDDEPENLRVLGSLLVQQGYTVRSFPKGKPALESARTEPPDLILLDIRMPIMDGYEVCTLLKSSNTLKDIPVLFLSAVDETDGKIRAFELGAADYITKPFQPEEVLVRVRNQLALRKAKSQLQLLNQNLEKQVQMRTEQLRESEEKYRRIVTTANEGIISVDAQLNIIFANEIIARMVGRTVDEIVGHSGLEFIPREDHDHIRSRFKERKSGISDNYESRIIRLDGQIRWVQISSAPIMDPNEGFQEAVLLFTDITERKNIQTKLETAYQEISALKQQLEADNIYLQEEIKLEHGFDQIIGNSDAIKYALFRLEQVAKTNSTVIILGETGTGKELFARAIHDTSRRKTRPLIKVDCTALPEPLIQSELFGHAKGAFTGADRSRQGRFELAHNGTLFLDEIGELPFALQNKLLRVLQDGEFERLGDSRTVKTDVRVIAATNRDIKALVEAGRFREDLWYRLNVFPITLPPLRDRRADIPLLVDHFVRRIGKRVGRQIHRIPKSVMKQLVAYDWPGNVRELKHVLERSVIVSNGGSLSLYERLVPSSKPPASSKTLSHAEMERHHILQVLKQTRWVVGGPKGAARILKLHPNTLRYRIKKHGIRRPD